MKTSGKHFEFQEIIHHPRETVYLVLRDRMVDLIPLLPNVESVKTRERSEPAPGKLRMVNDWQGAPTAVPKVIQPFLKAEMTQWIDTAEWNNDAYHVNWRFELPTLNDLFRCEGTNYFDVHPSGTQVRLTGTLTIYPERVPGVPKFLARGIAPTLESWVLGLVKPNLTELPGVVGKFLDREKAG